MKTWSPQHYKLEGTKKKIDKEIIDSALEHAKRIRSKNNINPIFTLRHLSYLANVEYSFLRSVVYRDLQEPLYRYFQIRKKNSLEKRRIFIPHPQLVKVQKYIHQNILKFVECHENSFAYTPGISIVDAASIHTNSKWLIKLDITGFFESISEVSVYKVFRSLEFPALLSFELARICTWNSPRNRNTIPLKFKISKKTNYIVYSSTEGIELGHLPQGAPTSPSLSNLVCRELDKQLTAFSVKNELEYSRYSDDITFSSKNINFSRKDAIEIIKMVYKILIGYGFTPNIRKTKIIPPKAKKIVLGLNVDREKVNLDKKFKNKINQNIHFCLHPDIGPVRQAKYKKFSSVLGFKNHLHGLIIYALSIDKEFGEKALNNYNKIVWPIH